ncbi:MAG: DUF2752 domain-containing protein [Acidobacteriota bacterium]|nr:DUF2752 domain-containing protein [Acidobacteriota bacterium]
MRWANRFAINSGFTWGLAAVGAVVLFTLAVIPMDAVNNFPTFCPFKRYLGIECFGCGMTRALSAFLHGNIRDAIAYNRGVLFTLPLLALMALLPVGIVRRHA